MKRTIYYIVIIFLSLHLLYACNKNEEMPNMQIEDCAVENPIEDLEWLSLQKDNCSTDIDCKTYFYSAVFNFKRVFYNQLEGSFCSPNFSISLYNCDGLVVANYNEKTKFESEVTDIQFLHVCE